jgi:asparagine synthase (glutamine-hydrolysing)
MCGICGAMQLGDGRPQTVLDAGVLDVMTDVMTHRGPDDRGVYLSEGVALAVRRLSIVDLGGGHQPLASEDERIWAVQNGELYNYPELRGLLTSAGHRFRSRSDTELIPHAYEEFGERFAERLNGMFAIALWDERARRGLIVRDRLGIKPLYYARSSELLVFGSELKSVLASGRVEPELDYEAIDIYLRLGYFPSPFTPLRGVRKLPPGSMLVIEDGRLSEKRWWSYPQPSPPGKPRSIDEEAHELLELLRDAVKLQLMSDVPVGAMLSGGLDSSLLVALMAAELGSPVQTFSVAFGEDARNSELGDARFVANRIGTEHHELTLSLAEQHVDLPSLVWHLDEPMADLSSLGFLQLSGVAAQHVKVALCGQGPDELYGGYDKHRAAALVARFGGWPSLLRAGTGSMLGRLDGPIGRLGRTAAAGSAAARSLAMSGLASQALLARLVRGPLTDVDPASALRAVARLAPAGQPDLVAETLFIDGQLALVDDMLHFTDRTSMAHSLEVRVPYLDHRLVEHSAGIPSRHKVSEAATKIVLKRAARGLVPDSIIDKRKVGFFSLTTNAWLERQVRGPVADYLLDPGLRAGAFLDRGEVERLAAGHSARSEKQIGRFLLAILMLEVWLSTYLPRAFADTSRPRVESARP